jgi:AcrR family transcriptional regulator
MLFVMKIDSKKRLTKEDWLFAGFRALCDGGPAAIKAEAIARELKTTKGSFYWHFADIPAFQREMLLFWQIKATTQLIEALAPYDNNPADQLYRLIQLMIDLNSDAYGGFKAEPAIRHWAVFLPEAEQAIGNVDRLRLAWLRERFEKIGQEKEQATINAANFYALVMGLEQLELHGKASLKTGLTSALDQMLK